MIRQAVLIAIAFTLLTHFQPAARADLEVHTRRDTVVLTDGTEIPCRILMVTRKGVLIVETDPNDPEKKSQRIIPSENVRSILRDERNGAIEGLQTAAELARKVVKGSGFRKDDPKTEMAETGTVHGAEKGASGTVAEKSPGATVPTTGGPKSTATAPAGGKDVVVELPKGTLNARDLTDAYLSRFPELKSTGLELLGEGQVQELFNNARDGNENSRRAVESTLKAYLGATEKEKALPSRTVTPSRGGVTPERPLRRTIKEAEDKQ